MRTAHDIGRRVEDAAPSGFQSTLTTHDQPAVSRGPVTVLQVNVGKLCNQACHHCHVDAGPTRTEIMTAATAERVVSLVEASPGVTTVDLTGGAPELNPSFRPLVRQLRAAGRQVLVRCNLTVLFVDGMGDLPEFYRDHGVHLTCSLPCYTSDNVDRQRGRGVFSESIRALQRLNDLGYGRPGSGLSLDLVYNPLGAFLPPAQAELEARYKTELQEQFGIAFNDLIVITNMPIKRFAEMLDRQGALGSYMGLLVNHFNPRTVEHLMCRSMLSIGWDGTLYDCDFNQMLDLPLDGPATIWDLASCTELEGRPVTTAAHCFGCTAGAGSSCGGALQ